MGDIIQGGIQLYKEHKPETYLALRARAPQLNMAIITIAILGALSGLLVYGGAAITLLINGLFVFTTGVLIHYLIQQAASAVAALFIWPLILRFVAGVGMGEPGDYMATVRTCSFLYAPQFIVMCIAGLVPFVGGFITLGCWVASLLISFTVIVPALKMSGGKPA